MTRTTAIGVMMLAAFLVAVLLASDDHDRPLEQAVFYAAIVAGCIAAVVSA